MQCHFLWQRSTGAWPYGCDCPSLHTSHSTVHSFRGTRLRTELSSEPLNSASLRCYTGTGIWSSGWCRRAWMPSREMQERVLACCMQHARADNWNSSTSYSPGIMKYKQKMARCLCTHHGITYWKTTSQKYRTLPPHHMLASECSMDASSPSWRSLERCSYVASCVCGHAAPNSWQACRWVDQFAKGGATPLMVAAFFGRHACVQLLLQRGASLRYLMRGGSAIPLPSGSSVLHCAARGGSCAVGIAILKGLVRLCPTSLFTNNPSARHCRR